VTVATVLTAGTRLLAAMVTRSELIYGSFATLAGTFAVLYLVSQALLYAAEVAVVHHRRLWPRALDTSRPTPADLRALGSLATEQKRLAAERIEVEFNANSSTEDSAVGSPARVSTNGEPQAWSAPVGSGLLRLGAPSIQTDREGSRRISRIIKLPGHELRSPRPWCGDTRCFVLCSATGRVPCGPARAPTVGIPHRV
jgi:hypothetical protein